MTSRRSRLKAVANLPVRRKLPSLQETQNDISKANSTIFENNCDIKNSNKVNGSPVISCYSEDLKNVSDNIEENVKSYTKDNSAYSVCPRKNEENANLCNFNSSDKLEEVCSKQVESYQKQVENNNDINKNWNLNSNDVNLNNFQYQSNDQTNENFVASSISVDPVAESQTFSNYTQGIINSETINNKLPRECKNTENISVTCSSADGNECPIFSTNDNVVITMTDLNNPNLSESLNDVQIYTELVGSTDLFVNLPTLVNNESCESTEVFLDTEDPKRTLTPLVNCRIDSDVTNISTIINTSDHNKIESENLCNKSVLKTNIINESTDVENENTRHLSNSEKPGVNIQGNQCATHNTNSSQSIYRRGLTTVRRKRSKCSDFTKKLADARREFLKKYEKTKPDRSSLKMIDLIFYNPSSNPMESKTKPDKKNISQIEGIQEIIMEEVVDDPNSPVCDSEFSSNLDNESDFKNTMPVPQVKIGLNGEIILDEKSLIIETTESKRGREDLRKSVPIFEDRGSKVSYYRAKTRKTRDWTDSETKRFYKALNTIGPDFSLMQKYFPKRSRLELKNKFKREERMNRSLIDKALINPSEFDMTQLEKDLAVEKRAEEEEIEMKLCKQIKEKQSSRRARTKSSLLSREMIESDGESENNQIKIGNFESKKIIQSEKDKKKREINFIFQKFVLNETENEMSDFADLPNSPSSLYYPSNEGVV